jgi:CO dehydrogenase/acetyl-CoA synthase beta subunit
MSSIIEFLERLGGDAQLRQATTEEIALALADAKVEASASEAILARNVDELYALLKQAPMFCVQTVPRKEGEEEEEDEDEEEEGGEEKQKAPSKNAAASVAVARQTAELA